MANLFDVNQQPYDLLADQPSILANGEADALVNQRSAVGLSGFGRGLRSSLPNADASISQYVGEALQSIGAGNVGGDALVERAKRRRAAAAAFAPNEYESDFLKSAADGKLLDWMAYTAGSGAGSMAVMGAGSVLGRGLAGKIGGYVGGVGVSALQQAGSNLERIHREAPEVSQQDALLAAGGLGLAQGAADYLPFVALMKGFNLGGALKSVPAAARPLVGAAGGGLAAIGSEGVTGGLQNVLEQSAPSVARGQLPESFDMRELVNAAAAEAGGGMGPGAVFGALAGSQFDLPELPNMPRPIQAVKDRIVEAAPDVVKAGVNVGKAAFNTFTEAYNNIKRAGLDDAGQPLGVRGAAAVGDAAVTVKVAAELLDLYKKDPESLKAAVAAGDPLASAIAASQEFRDVFTRAVTLSPNTKTVDVAKDARELISGFSQAYRAYENAEKAVGDKTGNRGAAASALELARATFAQYVTAENVDQVAEAVGKGIKSPVRSELMEVIDEVRKRKPATPVAAASEQVRQETTTPATEQGGQEIITPAPTQQEQKVVKPPEQSVPANTPVAEEAAPKYTPKQIEKATMVVDGMSGPGGDLENVPSDVRERAILAAATGFDSLGQRSGTSAALREHVKKDVEEYQATQAAPKRSSYLTMVSGEYENASDPDGKKAKLGSVLETYTAAQTAKTHPNYTKMLADIDHIAQDGNLDMAAKTAQTMAIKQSDEYKELHNRAKQLNVKHSGNVRAVARELGVTSKEVTSLLAKPVTRERIAKESAKPTSISKFLEHNSWGDLDSKWDSVLEDDDNNAIVTAGIKAAGQQYKDHVAGMPPGRQLVEAQIAGVIDLIAKKALPYLTARPQTVRDARRISRSGETNPTLKPQEFPAGKKMQINDPLPKRTSLDDVFDAMEDDGVEFAKGVSTQQMHRFLLATGTSIPKLEEFIREHYTGRNAFAAGDRKGFSRPSDITSDMDPDAIIAGKGSDDEDVGRFVFGEEVKAFDFQEAKSEVAIEYGDTKFELPFHEPDRIISVFDTQKAKLRHAAKANMKAGEKGKPVNVTHSDIENMIFVDLEEAMAEYKGDKEKYLKGLLGEIGARLRGKEGEAAQSLAAFGRHLDREITDAHMTEIREEVSAMMARIGATAKWKDVVATALYTLRYTKGYDATAIELYGAAQRNAAMLEELDTSPEDRDSKGGVPKAWSTFKLSDMEKRMLSADFEDLREAAISAGLIKRAKAEGGAMDVVRDLIQNPVEQEADDVWGAEPGAYGLWKNAVEDALFRSLLKNPKFVGLMPDEVLNQFMEAEPSIGDSSAAAFFKRFPHKMMASRNNAIGRFDRGDQLREKELTVGKHWGWDESDHTDHENGVVSILDKDSGRFRTFKLQDMVKALMPEENPTVDQLRGLLTAVYDTASRSKEKDTKTVAEVLLDPAALQAKLTPQFTLNDVLGITKKQLGVADSLNASFLEAPKTAIGKARMNNSVLVAKVNGERFDLIRMAQEIVNNSSHKGAVVRWDEGAYREGDANSTVTKAAIYQAYKAAQRLAGNRELTVSFSKGNTLANKQLADILELGKAGAPKVRPQAGQLASQVMAAKEKVNRLEQVLVKAKDTLHRSNIKNAAKNTEAFDTATHQLQAAKDELRMFRATLDAARRERFPETGKLAVFRDPDIFTEEGGAASRIQSLKNRVKKLNQQIAKVAEPEINADAKAHAMYAEAVAEQVAAREKVKSLEESGASDSEIGKAKRAMIEVATRAVTARKASFGDKAARKELGITEGAPKEGKGVFRLGFMRNPKHDYTSVQAYNARVEALLSKNTTAQEKPVYDLAYDEYESINDLSLLHEYRAALLDEISVLSVGKDVDNVFVVTNLEVDDNVREYEDDPTQKVGAPLNYRKRDADGKPGWARPNAPEPTQAERVADFREKFDDNRSNIRFKALNDVRFEDIEAALDSFRAKKGEIADSARAMLRARLATALRVKPDGTIRTTGFTSAGRDTANDAIALLANSSPRALTAKIAKQGGMFDNQTTAPTRLSAMLRNMNEKHLDEFFAFVENYRGIASAAHRKYMEGVHAELAELKRTGPASSVAKLEEQIAEQEANFNDVVMDRIEARIEAAYAVAPTPQQKNTKGTLPVSRRAPEFTAPESRSVVTGKRETAKMDDPLHISEAAEALKELDIGFLKAVSPHLSVAAKEKIIAEAKPVGGERFNDAVAALRDAPMQERSIVKRRSRLAFDAGLHEGNDDTLEGLTKIIQDVLGKQWGDGITVKAGKEWMTEGKAITIIAGAGDIGISNAYHESVHAAVDVLRGLAKDGSKQAAETVKLFDTVANMPWFKANIMKVIGKITKGALPEAELEKIREDVYTIPEEAIAYAMQLKVLGHNVFADRTDSLLATIGRLIGDFVGISTNASYADKVVTALANKSIGKANFSDFILREALQKSRIDKMIDQSKKFAGPMFEMLRKIFGSLDAELRHIARTHGISALDDIADLTTLTGRGYVYRWRQLAKQYAQPVSHYRDTLIEENNANDAEEMLSAAMKNIRAGSYAADDVTKELWKHIQETNTLIGRDAGYLPTIFDTRKINYNAQDFESDALKYGKGDKSAKSIQNIQSGYHGNLRFDDLDVAEKWTQQNASAWLRSFLIEAAKDKAKMEKFGKETVAAPFGEKIQELIETAKGQGMTSSQHHALVDHLETVQNKKSYGMSPAIRQMMKDTVSYANILLLPLGIFSQLVDPLSIAARSGDLTDAVTSGLRGVRGLTEPFTGSLHDEASIMAEKIGLVERSVFVDSFSDLLTGEAHEGPLAKLNNMFFKWNLMDGYARSMRIAATETGILYIERHGQLADWKKGANGNSERWMREIGLGEGDLVYTKEGKLVTSVEQAAALGLQMTKAQEEKLYSAVSQFVEEASVRPNEATASGWMMNPWAMLIAHMKRFTWGYNHITLRRATNEMFRHGNWGPAMMLMTAVPVAGASMLMRDMLAPGADVYDSMSLAQYTKYSADKAGVTGFFGMADDTPSSWAGPTASVVSDAARKMDDGRITDALASLIPGARQLNKE